MNVPEVAEEPPELEAELVDFAAGLLDFTAGLLELAPGVVEFAAGLLEFAEPLAELAGAVGEPEVPAAELPEVEGWLPELACGDDPDEHPCRATTPRTAMEPTSVEVRRNIIRYIPPLTQQKPDPRHNVDLKNRHNKEGAS